VSALTDQTVIMPEVATFTATVTPGEPRAEVRWFKGPKQLTPDGKKYVAKFDGDKASLEILKSEVSDEAEYRFVAVNKVGEVGSKANLTVCGKLNNINNLVFLNFKSITIFGKETFPCD